MEFPSYEPVPQTPELADVGVAARLGAAAFRVGKPAALYGSYLVDGAFIQKCHDEPHTWILVVAIRRDQPGVWVKPVREKPSLAPVPQEEDEPPGPTFRRGGYFNLDLVEHLGLPAEPARYWLIVSMGDYITERMPFEIQ